MVEEEEKEDKGGCCHAEGQSPPRSPRAVALVAPRLVLGRDEERARKVFLSMDGVTVRLGMPLDYYFSYCGGWDLFFERFGSRLTLILTLISRKQILKI